MKADIYVKLLGAIIAALDVRDSEEMAELRDAADAFIERARAKLQIKPDGSAYTDDELRAAHAKGNLPWDDVAATAQAEIARTRDGEDDGA